MFNYSIKTKAILLVVLVAILIFVIVFVRYNNSRSNDLELVQQVKTLANSLEDFVKSLMLIQWQRKQMLSRYLI